MLDGNWRSNLADIGRIAAAIWVGFATGFWMASPQRLAQNRNPAIEKNAKENDGNPANRSAARDQYKAAYYSPGCDSPKNKEDALYCEVRRIADAAKEVVASSNDPNYSGWAQAGAAMVAIGVAIWAALEARRAAKASSAAAKISERSVRLSSRIGRQQARDARAAVSQAKSALEVQIRIEEPFLFVTRATPRKTAFFQVMLFELWNHGKTPAVITSYTAQWRGGKLSDVPSYPKDLNVPEVIIEPGKKAEHALFALAPTDSKEVEDATEGRVSVYFFGRIKYEDALGRKRVMGFCHRDNKNLLDMPKGWAGRSFFWQRAGGDAYNYDEPDKEA